MNGNPFLPSGSPAPPRDGRTPFFDEVGADPRDEPGVDAPPFSVVAFGDEYFIKCGPAPTDWDPPDCGGGGDAFRFLTTIPAKHTYLDDGFFGPLTLVFNKAVSNASVVQGASLLLTGAALAGLGTITHAVSANTIVLHNDVGGGDEWFSDGELLIDCTAAILSTGIVQALEQPALSSFNWVVS